MHKFTYLFILLLAFGSRTYHLDFQSFWSDEGISLLRSAQPLGQMIEQMPVEHMQGYFVLLHYWLRLPMNTTLPFAFHRSAAFEHPPLWQLTIHLWSKLLGQSEFALRLLSAMAGVLALPLLWSIQRALWPTDRALHWLTALLFITSPSLLLYSQEARMYPIQLSSNRKVKAPSCLS